MTLYFGVGCMVAAARLLGEKLGLVRYERQDAAWLCATALTDVLWWPLVLLTLLLRRAAHAS